MRVPTYTYICTYTDKIKPSSIPAKKKKKKRKKKKRRKVNRGRKNQKAYANLL